MATEHDLINKQHYEEVPRHDYHQSQPAHVA